MSKMEFVTKMMQESLEAAHGDVFECDYRKCLLKWMNAKNEQQKREAFNMYTDAMVTERRYMNSVMANMLFNKKEGKE